MMVNVSSTYDSPIGSTSAASTPSLTYTGKDHQRQGHASKIQATLGWTHLWDGKSSPAQDHTV